MPFENKQYFIFLLLIPICIILYFITKKIRSNKLKLFANNNIIQFLIPNSNTFIENIKFFFFILELFFVIIALCGPKFGKKMLEINRKGLDIIIALDTSTSMLAEDIKPNRLTIAKAELTNIISKLDQNRIGIIAFAGDSIVKCPLTLDINTLKFFLNSLDTNSVPIQGTNISKVIKLAGKLFNKEEKKYKILIILTDGEDHSKNVKKLAEEAKEKGIKIISIGFGNKDGEIIPIKDNNGKIIKYKKDKNGNTVKTKLDEKLLIEIAEITEGKYYYSQNGILNTDKIISDINNYEKKNLSSKSTLQYEERFYYFLILALICFIIEKFIIKEKNIKYKI